MANESKKKHLMNRKEFIKLSAGTVAAAAMGLSLPSRAAAAEEKELRYFLNQAITTLDPQLHAMRVFESALRNCYESLIQRSADMKRLEPALAVSWQQINDLTLRMKLRRGVKFHNGEPFNAHAVKFSIDRVLDPQTGAPYRASRYSTLASPAVVDEYTIDIKTTKPDPVLLSRLNGWHMVVIPPQYFKEKGAEAFAKSPVGTGPFKFVDWVRDGALTFEKNKDYWRGEPKLDRIVFRSVPENQARVAALKSGEAHIITHLPPDDIPSIKSDSRLRIEVVPSTGVLFGQMFCTRPPTNNKLVRQAMNYAIDVESLIKNVLGGYGIRIATALPEFIWGYDPNIKPYPYDPGKAKQLLKEAGYPNGVEITFDSVQGRYLKDKELAQAMAGMLEKAGFKVTLNLYEVSRVWDMQLQGKIGQLSIWGWGNQMFDADDTLYPEFHYLPGSTQQRDSLLDPDIDKWTEEARVTLDSKRRQELYTKVQERVKENAPWIFLFQQVDVYGASNSVNWKPRSDEMSWLYAASIK